MKLIAHRGNTNGRVVELENSPEYIMKAIMEGFYCEVDVREIDGKLWLGHDEPQYPTDIEFLLNPKLYVHCKDLSSLVTCLSKGVNCFFHNNDDFTLTSKREVWVYPGRLCNLPGRLHFFSVRDKASCIEVVLDDSLPQKGVRGCCSDYVTKLKKELIST